MGILDNVQDKNKGSTGTSNNGQGKREERAPSKIWLNIGTTVGEGEDAIFISLPSGLPLDDMKNKQVKGGEDYAHLMQAKNGLLAKLQKLGSTLAPGERRTIPLEVEIYRIEEERPAVGNAGENPLLKALDLQLGG